MFFRIKARLLDLVHVSKLFILLGLVTLKMISAGRQIKSSKSSLIITTYSYAWHRNGHDCRKDVASENLTTLEKFRKNKATSFKIENIT